MYKRELDCVDNTYLQYVIVFVENTRRRSGIYRISGTDRGKLRGQKHIIRMFRETIFFCLLKSVRKGCLYRYNASETGCLAWIGRCQMGCGEPDSYSCEDRMR